MEDHNPVGKSDYLSVQHIERYRFALTRLKSGQRVLDVASGTGYGTVILLKHGCETTGADYNEQVLSSAGALWKYKVFTRANVLNLPFKNNSFDAVVSFETIEHVLDGNHFLSEIDRVLKPGGNFLCSTPNIRYTAHPPYHVKEYKPDEFYKLIERRFPGVEQYGQYFKPSDRVKDLLKRHVYVYITALLEKTGIKKIRKHLLCFLCKKGIEAAEHSNDFQELWVERILKTEIGNSVYKVRPFTVSKWLRVMVATARKGVTP